MGLLAKLAPLHLLAQTSSYATEYSVLFFYSLTSLLRALTQIAF